LGDAVARGAPGVKVFDLTTQLFMASSIGRGSSSTTSKNCLARQTLFAIEGVHRALQMTANALGASSCVAREPDRISDLLPCLSRFDRGRQQVSAASPEPRLP